MVFDICREGFLSHFLLSPRGLLLICSSSLWLSLCFSLWYSLYSLAFLQVELQLWSPVEPVCCAKGLKCLEKIYILQCLFGKCSTKITNSNCVFCAASFCVLYSVRMTSLSLRALKWRDLPQCVDNHCNYREMYILYCFTKLRWKKTTNTNHIQTIIHSNWFNMVCCSWSVTLEYVYFIDQCHWAYY